MVTGKYANMATNMKIIVLEIQHRTKARIFCRFPLVNEHNFYIKLISGNLAQLAFMVKVDNSIFSNKKFWPVRLPFP